MDSSKAYSQADGKGLGFGAKRPKSGGPQSTQRGELKVYRAGSAEGRLPVASSLRKQRSMTNLAVLTDAEKKLHLYEPKWCDDMAKPGVAGLRKTGKPTGKVPGGGAPLSRNLSKSEHSLFQGKHKPFAPLAAAPGKQSRIPRAPYAEVKPLSKAPEDGRSDDEILSSKAKAAPKKTGAGGDSGSKGQEEEGADKPFLKVDPELVVTVLGDLEQLLFSQMLPESQRKRTVQNVLDLRQNLEDTMLSLRGSQQSHNVGYDSDDTNARSMSSLSNRSSPLSWRHGQASPRLQAGDAPSSAAGGYQGSKTLTQYVAQTMPARCSGRLSGTSRVDLLDDGDLKSGCLSDSDLLGKNLPDDDDNLTNWDESSSISSGLSDGDGEVSDNLSSEEFNASSSLNSLPNTPLGSRRNSSIMLRTDAEKRSLVESGLSWYSEDGKAGRKLDACGYDTGSLKTEAPSKWRKKPPSLSDELSVKEEARKPQRLAASGSFKKSRNPPVGVTSPITHTSQSMLKLAKSLGRPPSLAHLDKVNSNSLDSCVTIQDLPPKVPPYSKLQDLASSHSTTRLTPSPAPVLHIDSSGSYTSDSLGGSPLLYPKLSTMHRSMESLPLQMSVPSRARFSPKESQGSERGVGTWGAGSRTSLNLSEDGMKPGRRHSHNATSERNSPPQLPSPTRTIHLLSATKAPLTNVAPISSSGTPRISRSNSIGPPGDCELYGSSPLGSTVSLAERPKSMMRSGSFRETADDHGSVLSLASTASSNYSSSNEDRIQGEQIRKLRRELESSQEKVADLTMQLSANLGQQANLVAAFEQSLALMTARLQTLSASSEQKDSELNDLRDTIEILKTKNTEAHDIIQGALNNSEIVSKLQINRQNSSESLSSLTSTASHTSMGSLKEQEAKKKKKKSWLRSSFNKAFSKKGAKPTGPYADIEEIATPESSVPPSPKVNRVGADPPPLCEGSEVADDKVVSDLRSELWEKERKLTDIRLEALTSAHQLEQLQETMTNMQKTVDNLKVENDQLKTSGLSPCPSPGPSSSVSQSSGLTSLASLSPRHSVAVRDARRTSTGIVQTLSSMDYASLSSQRDDHRVRVVVCVADLLVFKDQEVKQQDFFLGTVRVNGRMDWPMLDSAVSQAFKVDPTSSLGLSTDSIYSYSMGHIKRVLGGEAPETQPSRCMSRGPTSITVALKLKEKCVDSLVFETLIPKPMMQHYISLLLKHRRLILSGPSGTGKTYLASRLAEYLVDRSAREVSDGIVVTFNMHRQSCKDLQLYLSNLANQIDRESSSSENPLVIIVDDIHDPASVSELINGALTCKYHKPYIIGTSNQPVKMTANHSLHLSFRMVTFSNNVEPANGFLVRYLHRKLMESEDERNLTNEDLVRVLDWVPKLWYHLHTFLEKHSTSDFLIPCFFLSCPVTVEEFRSWFIDLWNHSIIPYLQEGAKDGIKFHGQKAVWEDPVEWVRGTLPWPSAQQDQAKLFHLPPPSIGSSSPGQAGEEKSRKETTPSSTESDPLMAMLLKLQEAANYIESPDK
uniref:Neuron navigator 1 n=1 Tax=Hippocampus comes TaxID=109280 RepID=A0A3Q3DPV2_HIPCM